MPTPEPLDLLRSFVNSFERLKRYEGDQEVIKVGYRVLRIASDVEGDLSHAVEHAHLLPEGGTLEDLVVECLAKVEDALEALDPEAMETENTTDEQLVDAE